MFYFSNLLASLFKPLQIVFPEMKTVDSVQQDDNLRYHHLAQLSGNQGAVNLSQKSIRKGLTREEAVAYGLRSEWNTETLTEQRMTNTVLVLSVQTYYIGLTLVKLLKLS